jgi:hypothetical protein
MFPVSGRSVEDVLVSGGLAAVTLSPHSSPLPSTRPTAPFSIIDFAPNAASHLIQLICDLICRFLYVLCWVCIKKLLCTKDVVCFDFFCTSTQHFLDNEHQSLILAT